ncbi:hypothetical protein N865_14995 [Intrasporangium oryzae NRRL B-24470]|uniref:Blue (type 1) copper domain-containing protein n=1 Tax=Intrasporangium oryzae NRRL B-24470 TaxID=1386089 RepID=W9G5D0_9MICO|nr:hypothetical protein [Intrasporangium oryzae]EWT00502.1 hypothetical protein N865_14995 [Intrasporangium oryzae NRRL B-24470]
MRTLRHVWRTRVAVRRAVGLAAALALSGCTTVVVPPGGGMMGPAQGYRDSSLTCTPPGTLPGAVVEVRVADMGMSRMMGGDAPLGAPMMLRALPATVPAGVVTLVVENVGWRTHEVVVLPLAPGEAAGQRVPGADGKVDEAGSLGEVSASCAEGSGEGVDSGAVGWTTLTLGPGRYELVCNLRNHYANGMYQAITVQ